MTDKDMAAPSALPTFEQAMQELETIVAQMDDGSLPLEESLAAYRRGAALVQQCQQALEAVREQVQILDGALLRPLPESAFKDADAIE